MYTLSNALVKTRGYIGRWQTADVSAIPIRDLWKTFSHIYLFLTNPIMSEEVSLDLSLMMSDLTNIVQNQTVPQWLTTLGGQSLPTSSTLPTLDFDYVKYRDAIQAGYSIDLQHRTADPSVPFPSSEKSDLLLKKELVDPAYFINQCLVSVNGLLHYAIEGVGGVQVMGGGDTLRVSNENHVGILSFLDIGEIQTIPITADMVSSAVPSGDLKTHLNVTLPNTEGLEDKSFLISIGGFLHSLGGLVKYVGNGILQVDVGNLMLESRFFELLKRIDISTLTEHLTKKNGGWSQLSMEELYSTEVITALFSLTQSFVIIINNDDLTFEEEELQRTVTPNLYLSHTKPLYPVQFNKGELFDYWAIVEDSVYVLSGTENRRPNYLHETTHVHLEPSIDDSRMPSNPWTTSRAFYMKLGTLRKPAA